MSTLTFAQRNAMIHARSRAQHAYGSVDEKIDDILSRASADASARQLLSDILTHGSITLNFHPDRLRSDGLSVVEGMCRDGRYRNQFETGLSNGSLTAFAGGERDAWERHLFGDAYHATTAESDERPKYGAFNIMRYLDGASPRFGSCYFVLKGQVAERCTFTWGDSHLGPEHLGTVDTFGAIALALLHEVERTGHALGTPNVQVPDLARLLAENGPEPRIGRALDAYVEVQVHGPIRLAEDVEALVMDPSFAGTKTGADLQRLATTFGIALRYHPGFVLKVRDVPDDFRGPRMPQLACRVARFSKNLELLDAATIGQAAVSLSLAPDEWRDWDTAEQTRQHLKQLWHVLVQFGQSAAEVA